MESAGIFKVPAFSVSLRVRMELSLPEFRVVKMEKHIVITEWKRYTIRHAEHIHKCTLDVAERVYIWILIRR